jgi:Ser/Thr protein kinase RdoA (MazF antagonist)
MSLEDLPGFTPVYEETMVMLTAQWDAVVLGADRPAVPDSVRDQRRTVAALKKHFRTKNPRFTCLLHGDPHPSNTFTDRDDNPSFLDVYCG